MQPRPRHQRRQPLHELQRAHHHELQSLVGKRRPGDVAAQLLQPLAIVRFDPHGRVQTETVDVSAQGLACCAPARHRAP